MGLCKRHIDSALYYRDVLLNQGIAAIRNKLEGIMQISLLKVIKEYATDSSRFPPVLVLKVFIAPLFKSGIVGQVMLVAHVLDGLVEVDSIFLKQIRWCKITPSSKPSCSWGQRYISALFTKLKVSRESVCVSIDGSIKRENKTQTYNLHER